jgi:hypothetical protein
LYIFAFIIFHDTLRVSSIHFSDYFPVHAGADSGTFFLWSEFFDNTIIIALTVNHIIDVTTAFGAVAIVWVKTRNIPHSSVFPWLYSGASPVATVAVTVDVAVAVDVVFTFTEERPSFIITATPITTATATPIATSTTGTVIVTAATSVTQNQFHSQYKIRIEISKDIK